MNRRQFLQKSTLLAAAATAVGTATQAGAQINSTAGLSIKPVRLGFIGAGIRGTLLMEAASGIAGAQVVAVADCYKGHLDRAQELISPAPAVTGDYTEILSRADIDAVVIAAPDHWHLKMTQEALAAGKHVYIEKPMTHSWEEGEAFIAAAEKSGKVVQVGSQYMSMGVREEGRRVHQERQARTGHARRGQDPPQQQRRRLVLPHPARRVAVHGRLQAVPRLRDAAGLRPPPLLPVASLLGLLRRPADGSLRAPHHGHAPVDGRAGTRERLHVRRHLPLEELPRGARPDDVDGEVPRRLRAAPDQHVEQRPPGTAAHLLRQRGHARVQRRVVHVLPRTARRQLRLLHALVAEGDHRASSGS